MIFYIYILYSETSDKYYVGSSQDPWNRLVQHNQTSLTTFTSKYRPWILKAVFRTNLGRGDTQILERFIKRQKSRTLLAKMIDPDFILVGRLAKLVRVPHLRD
ncbi:GIY-YIG nuclease family protein [Zeaxanthinibacter enoshimensis]|uniref:Putative endonuclease n=1 Tax=Zeaxanthinibacter enoshimensis TaxID=392009 RepID=A0A4R6TQ49_9FLAO|nr:putative endonuclease [Zeaxanthinibacter enoshimensis]